MEKNVLMAFFVFVNFLFLFKTSDLWGSWAFEEWKCLKKARFIVKSCFWFCRMLTWGFLIFPDSVYVTVRWKRKERFQIDVLTSKPPLPGKKKQLQSVKLSSSTEWRSEMMKTNEGTWDNSIGKHQHPRQSQSLPWVKAKILVLSWWLTGRYFQLLIIPVIVTYKEKSVFWKLQLVFGSAVWNGDVSFTVTQNKTLWGGEGPVLTLNSAVTFSSVLTNVGTAVMKINFLKKLYIQFAVDIPYVLLFVFIYDYQFNINIVSKKTPYENEYGCIQYVWFLSTKNESDSECFSADIQSTKYFKGLNLMNSQHIWELGKSCKMH